MELDFFRGGALLVILWDHLHWFVGTAAPLHYGFSDAATVFIFLSGYVAGLVYWKTYHTMGFRAVLSKAARRSLQIYIAHIVGLAFLLAIAGLVPPTETPNPMHDLLWRVSVDPWGSVIGLISLQYVPTLFDILPLYVILVLTLPAILVGMRKDWRIVIGVALALYVAVQVMPFMDISNYFPTWSLNPLAWFLPFSAAAVIAVKSRGGAFHLPVKSSYLVVTGAVLLYSFLDLATVQDSLAGLGILPRQAKMLFPSPFPLIGKTNLQPFSLIHFSCLVYVVAALRRRWLPAMTSPVAKPLILSGQHSLPLFSVGIVLTYVLAYVIVSGGRPELFYPCALLGWTVTLALGFVLFRRASRASSVSKKTSENNKARAGLSVLGP